MSAIVDLYGDGDMASLLQTMKEKTMQSETELRYLDEVRYHMGDTWWRPFDKYHIYLSPMGSPETRTGYDSAGSDAMHYKHRVQIDLVTPFHGIDEEDGIVGRTSKRVGLTNFVEDVADYYENNFLGMTALDKGVPPSVSVPEDAYLVFQVEAGQFIRIARLMYFCQTRHFVRPVTT